MTSISLPFNASTSSSTSPATEVLGSALHSSIARYEENKRRFSDFAFTMAHPAARAIFSEYLSHHCSDEMELFLNHMSKVLQQDAAAEAAEPGGAGGGGAGGGGGVSQPQQQQQQQSQVHAQVSARLFCAAHHSTSPPNDLFINGKFIAFFLNRRPTCWTCSWRTIACSS